MCYDKARTGNSPSHNATKIKSNDNHVMYIVAMYMTKMYNVA